MKLVEQSSGAGELSWQDRVFANVRYDISRYQGMSSVMPIPGLHRIEGRLDLGRVPERRDMVGGDLTLRLEDGRTLRLTLTGEDGRVLAEGHGPSRCMCC